MLSEYKLLTCSVESKKMVLKLMPACYGLFLDCHFTVLVKIWKEFKAFEGNFWF